MKTINVYLTEKLHLNKGINRCKNEKECIDLYMDDFINTYKDGKYKSLEYEVKKGRKYLTLILLNVGTQTKLQLDDRPFYKNPHPRVDKDDRSDLIKIVEDIVEFLEKNGFNYEHLVPIAKYDSTEITFEKK